MSGFWSYDTVDVGGVKANKAVVGEATKLNGVSFSVSKFDGILGMAWPQLSVDLVTPIFVDFWSQGSVQDNSFAFYLTPIPG